MLSTGVNACTDFKLTASDGTILITRSMEFGQDLKSNLRSSPRGRHFKNTVSNKPGLSWQSIYGYVYVDGFNLDASFDGINETGLTFEYLYLPGDTKYQTVPAGKEIKSIPYIYFGDWILGNFKSVKEVKEALQDVYVVAQTIPQLGNAILPAHASIYDSQGNGIVVEFYNNEIKIFENIGIMTNSPKYDWHVTNLRNYINLSANNPAAIVKDGMIYSGTGQGSGSVGIPGDASPPSRFVKTAFMINNVYKAADAPKLINLAEHIINNVDLPAGYVRSTEQGTTATDTTQWVVFKDITHKTLYYRTYDDMSLRAISMSEIDFSNLAPRLKMPLMTANTTNNITSEFSKSIEK